MKLQSFLHKHTEVSADAWIFRGDRPSRTRRAADRLSKFGVIVFALYVVVLIADAVLRACNTTY